jgi:hypothetical protein
MAIADETWGRGDVALGNHLHAGSGDQTVAGDGGQGDGLNAASFLAEPSHLSNARAAARNS